MRVFLSSVLVTLSSSVSAQTLDIKLVKPFHKLERSQSLLIHHGQIVAGRTGTEAEGRSFVESYDQDTYALKSSVPVNHSVRRLKVIDSCKLLALSTEHFTVINYCVTGEPQVVRRTTPAGSFAHEGAALSDTEFALIDPTVGLYRVNLHGQVRNLGENITYTRSMDFWQGALWVTNYLNVWKIDPQTGARSRVFKTDNEIYGFKYTVSFTPAGENPMIVASAGEDQKLVFIDAESGRPIHEFLVEGEPAAMVVFGQCLATVTSNSSRVHFIKMENGEPRLISSWDALSAGDMLKLPTQIAVSEVRRTVYLRSSYPCPSCTNTQSSIFSLYETDEKTFDQCL